MVELVRGVIRSLAPCNEGIVSLGGHYVLLCPALSVSCTFCPALLIMLFS